MQRPDFDTIKDYEEFSKYYWYREELIKICKAHGKKTYATYDKSALQWNKFVKDFCADDATKIFPERLKATAALWKIVRKSDMKKEYSHELFETYKDEICR